MFFINLNINSLLPKIDEISYVGKLTNGNVIELSETKLDNTVLSSEDLVRSDLVSSDHFRRGGVACFLKNSISYNRKPNFCINTESIFIEIFRPRSKLVFYIDLLINTTL